MLQNLGWDGCGLAQDALAVFTKRYLEKPRPHVHSLQPPSRISLFVSRYCSCEFELTSFDIEDA